MQENKTSIVVTTHNYSAYLKECVDSLISQSILPMEIIVVDDASSDSPEDVMKEYSENEIVKFYSVDYRNAQSARNFGFEKAKGEYLMFLDADDYLREDFLEKTQSILDKKKNVDCVYSDRENFGPSGALEKIGQKKEWKTDSFSYSELKKHNYISLPALVRRDKFTGFDEGINRFQDWDAWLTYLEGKKAHHIPEPLFYVRFHGNNKTFAANKYTEKLKVQMKHDLIKHDKTGKNKKYSLLRNKKIVLIVGDRSNFKLFLAYIEKLKSLENKIYVYFSKGASELRLSLDLLNKIESMRIRYRVARRHNSDEVCNSFRDGKFVSPYGIDFLIILGSEVGGESPYPMPVKFKTDLLWNSKKDNFLDIVSIDEANWIFNRKGIKKFFNL